MMRFGVSETMEETEVVWSDSHKPMFNKELFKWGGFNFFQVLVFFGGLPNLSFFRCGCGL